MTSYFYVTYLATTKDGRQCTGSVSITVESASILNKKKTMDIITESCKSGVPVNTNSVVILNWIKFDNKSEHDLFNLEG